MHMIPVASSKLSAVGYENGVLHVRFNSGALYEYTNVPVSVYQSLMNAASHGSYFSAHIRNVYPYRRIG